MSNENQVPKITISGCSANSNANLDKDRADTCACWNEKDLGKARKALRYSAEVYCNDATAYAAMLALSIEMMMQGKKVKAKIIKSWPQPPIVLQ